MKKEKIRISSHDPELGHFHFETIHYHAKGFAPAIFITPIFGGIALIEHALARLFARNGFHAFITDFMPGLDFKRQILDLDIHDRTYKKSIAGLESLRLHLKNMPHIDHENVGLFGMSLGGIFTSLNTKVNRNFKASVIIAGSGSHPEILSQSKQPIMWALKEMRKKAFNLNSDEDYKALMSAHNEMDSLKIFRRVDSDSVMMFISEKDSLIPTHAQMETMKEFGSKRVMILQKRHYEMILTVPFTYFKSIRDFYNERLYQSGRA